MNVQTTFWDLSHRSISSIRSTSSKEERSDVKNYLENKAQEFFKNKEELNEKNLVNYLSTILDMGQYEIHCNSSVVRVFNDERFPCCIMDIQIEASLNKISEGKFHINVDHTQNVRQYC